MLLEAAPSNRSARRCALHPLLCSVIHPSAAVINCAHGNTACNDNPLVRSTPSSHPSLCCCHPLRSWKHCVQRQPTGLQHTQQLGRLKCEGPYRVPGLLRRGLRWTALDCRHQVPVRQEPPLPLEQEPHCLWSRGQRLPLSSAD